MKKQRETGKQFELVVAAPLPDRLIDAAFDIAMYPAGAEEACFSHAIFCQVGMPRKRTAGVEFERTNGAASLLLTAGKLFDKRRESWVQQELPYGPKPRLILINLTSAAIAARSRFIDVGRSTREFMLRVGLEPKGSEYKALRRQTAALSACRMQLGVGLGDHSLTLDTQPIRKFDAWIQPDLDKSALWPGQVELSEEYFESALRLAVPLDERAVAALRGSALALDCYSWLAHRLCRIKQPTVEVSWRALKTQFGSEYKNLDDFRKEFRSALRMVLPLYDSARVEEGDSGLILRPSLPPVPKRLVRGG